VEAVGISNIKDPGGFEIVLINSHIFIWK